MRKILVMILAMVFTTNAIASDKLCVWEPNGYKVANTSNYADTVYITVTDNRVMPEKTKINYTSEQLVNYLYDIVRQVFPNAIIVKDSQSETPQNSIGFNIKITYYGAIFNPKFTAKDVVLSPIFTGGSSKWWGKTSYEVDYFDTRNGQNKKNTLTFNGEDSGKNWGGYSTAKKMLSNSFKEATNALTTFLITTCTTL